jgi:hypothetical protein
VSTLHYPPCVCSYSSSPRPPPPPLRLETRPTRARFLLTFWISTKKTSGTASDGNYTWATFLMSLSAFTRLARSMTSDLRSSTDATAFFVSASSFPLVFPSLSCPDAELTQKGIAQGTKMRPLLSLVPSASSCLVLVRTTSAFAFDFRLFQSLGRPRSRQASLFLKLFTPPPCVERLLLSISPGTYIELLLPLSRPVAICALLHS